ncbi:Inner centromere protein B-like [Scleropages formosus]|uniref:Inner centromere protein B-like n=1 Tax=Scleropages formosus TaxID=113540 RepID=A0A0N8JX00_SCLFO|nr:inner centromere protein isoform X2 [Scleropages formosus]KPP62353.1 Inner centromere protein B-like [Scleropages formosus]
MSLFLATMRSLREMFTEKLQEFQDEVENVHMVWLQEIQQEAVRMFSSDFSAEPELMPKTPSQKKSNRRKRVSLSRGDTRSKRRFSRGTRSNLRRSSVQTLVLIAEEAGVPDLDAQSSTDPEQPKRNTRRNKQQEAIAEAEAAKRVTRKGARVDVGEPEMGTWPDTQPAAPPDKKPAEESQKTEEKEVVEGRVAVEAEPCTSAVPSQDASRLSPQRLEPIVLVSAADRRSAELQLEQMNAVGRLATKVAIAGTQATASRRSSMRRSSVRCSLSRRRSLSGLRHSMTQESMRRASRRSFLKKKARRSSSAGSSTSEEVIVEAEEEAGEQVECALPEDGVQVMAGPEAPQPEVVVMVEEEIVTAEDDNIRRFTRSMAQTTVTQPAASNAGRPHTPTTDGSGEKPAATVSSLRVNPSNKRLASSSEDIGTPKKKPSPPKKMSSTIKPNMRSFLHTVQKNQVLMSTPGSLGRNAIMKSFIKHTTPLRVDTKERERLRLEALKKKEEQEIERKKKMEEDKKRKQEEMKRKRDERLRKVVEARVKEEQKEEEKKRKIEMKFAQMEEKNDKMRVERLAEEKVKKKVASKRQEELELRRKQEEEARRKKIQQAEEEKRQQELQAKRRAEEEQERARKLAEARRAQERERELEKEREKERLRQQQAAAERERLEREKAAALQRELEKAAREKERREAEERRLKAELERQKAEQERLERQKAELERQKVEQERLERQKAEQEKAALQKRAAEALSAAKNAAELQESVLKTPGGKAAATGLNVTVDVEKSPQSYEITPKGRSKPAVKNPDDYGMDQNSDDSTDDESAPRKPIPSWAEGRQLQQAMLQQYFNPIDVDSYFGEIEAPKLERIFRKSKPRYFKRTSSAVWQSPPRAEAAAF